MRKVFTLLEACSGRDAEPVAPRGIPLGGVPLGGDVERWSHPLLVGVNVTLCAPPSLPPPVARLFVTLCH